MALAARITLSGAASGDAAATTTDALPQPRELAVQWGGGRSSYDASIADTQLEFRTGGRATRQLPPRSHRSPSVADAASEDETAALSRSK